MSNPNNLPAFSTLAQLRALPAASATQYPMVYVAAGSSVYQWNASATATDNNWTVINPTGNVGNGRWNRINPVPQALNGAAVANLKDWMDITYGAGNWTYWHGTGLGTDCGPAIDAACAWIHTNFSYGKLYVPGGPSFRLVNPPSAANLSGILIEGDTIFASQFICDNDNAVMFHWSGAGGYTGGGMKNIAAYIDDGHPSSSTIFILLSGDSTFQPDQFIIENLYITALGNSYWATGFEIDGRARTVPQGVRGGSVNFYQQFRCQLASFEFLNAVQWTCNNLGAYVPKAASTGDELFISGGGSNLTNTTQLHINGSVFGIVSAQNAKNNTINNSIVASLQGDATFKTYVIEVFCASPPSNPYNTTAGSFRYNVLQTL